MKTLKFRQSFVLRSLIVVILTIAPSAFAGKMVILEGKGKNGQNWRVDSPQIVVAMGLLPDNLSRYYIKKTQSLLQSLAASWPGLRVIGIKNARGSQLVDLLRNPRTVGLVYISHTYTNSLGGAVFVGADYQPIPNEIISAATPSLRFVAFLGCHGPSIIKQYQVQYELDRLAGSPLFFSTDDTFLTTKSFIFGRDGLLKALRSIASYLKAKAPQLDGLNPEKDDSQIQVAVKDVIERYEPRYVFINNRIVGVLGGLGGFFNKSIDSQRFLWTFPSAYLKPSSCQRVTIRSAELTPGALADDYVLQDIQIATPHETFSAQVELPMHLGDDTTIPDLEFKPPKLSKAQEAVLRRDPQLWEEYQEKIERLKIEHQVRLMEWIDRDQSHWPPLAARFFSSCLKPLPSN